MATANIKSRASIEHAYSAEAFAEDATHNLLPTDEIVRGVLILSAPNAAGDFVVERGAHHVGEPPSRTFLAPYRRGDTAPLDPGHSDPRAGYAQFVADIVSVAERFGFDPEKSPRRDEPRLQGLRQ